MSAVTMFTTGPCKNYIVMEELDALLSPEQAAEAFAKWLLASVSGVFQMQESSAYEIYQMQQISMLGGNTQCKLVEVQEPYLPES